MLYLYQEDESLMLEIIEAPTACFMWTLDPWPLTHRIAVLSCQLEAAGSPKKEEEQPHVPHML